MNRLGTSSAGRNARVRRPDPLQDVGVGLGVAVRGHDVREPVLAEDVVGALALVVRALADQVALELLPLARRVGDHQAALAVVAIGRELAAHVDLVAGGQRDLVHHPEQPGLGIGRRATLPSELQGVLAGDRQGVADLASRQLGVDAFGHLDLAGGAGKLDDVAAQV